MSKHELEQQLIHTAHALRERGLLFLGAHANLSARAGDQLLITRGGSMAELGSADLAWLDLQADPQHVEGFSPVFREILAMHTRLYRQRGDIGALVHCHPRYSTAFAVAQRAIPAVYEPMLRQGIQADVPVVAWAPRGSEASVNGILDAFASPSTVAVLLANHGGLVGGGDLAEALGRLTAMEEAAELALHAQALGGAKPLPAAAYADVNERMQQFQKAS